MVDIHFLTQEVGLIRSQLFVAQKNTFNLWVHKTYGNVMIHVCLFILISTIEKLCEKWIGLKICLAMFCSNYCLAHLQCEGFVWLNS